MDTSEFWIGDPVLILSKNLRGLFDGMSVDNRALIKTSTGIVVADLNDLTIFEEEEEEVKLKLTEPEDEPGIRPIKEHQVISHVIDLHYEILAPGRIKNPHLHIMDFQLEKCREFMEAAIRKKFPFIRIIHGRGEGKLKAAVEELLKTYPEVNLVNSTPDSGALEIWMK